MTSRYVEKVYANAYGVAAELRVCGQHEAAYQCVLLTLKVAEDNFQALCLAATCAAETKRYDKMYEYARRAINDGQRPETPKVVSGFLWMMSWLPWLRGLRSVDKTFDRLDAKCTSQMREYIVWYESERGTCGD